MLAVDAAPDSNYVRTFDRCKCKYVELSTSLAPGRARVDGRTLDGRHLTSTPRSLARTGREARPDSVETSAPASTARNGLAAARPTPMSESDFVSVLGRRPAVKKLDGRRFVGCRRIAIARWPTQQVSM